MNIILRTVYALSGMFLFCNASVASTNELWFSRVNASFMHGLKDVRIQQFCVLLEKESQKLDQSGHGIRIIYALKPLCGEIQATIHFSVSTLPLIDWLRVAVQGSGLDVVVTEDVAIIGRKDDRCVSIMLSGKCYDVKTGKSINTFRIEAIPWPGVLSISTNGIYSYAVPCEVNILFNDDVMLPTGGAFNTKKDFRVIAPGYKEKHFSVDIFLQGKTGYQEVDLPLEPNSAVMSQQSTNENGMGQSVIREKAGEK